MKQIAIIGTLLVAACATSDDEYPVVPTPNFSSMGCGDLEMAWRNAQVQQDRLSRERQAINHRYANLDSSNVLYVFQYAEIQKQADYLERRDRANQDALSVIPSVQRAKGCFD